MKVNIFVAIDIQNLWYTAINAFGKKYRVNFQKLRSLINDNIVTYVKDKFDCGEGDIDIEAIAYVVVSPDHDSSGFTERLLKLRYKIKKRYMRYEKSAEGVFRNVSKSDWDVGITVDTMSRAMHPTEDLNLFVLVSGDGDYCYLVEELRRLDVDVDVYTFDTGGSKSLRTAATRAFILDKGVVFGITRSA